MSAFGTKRRSVRADECPISEEKRTSVGRFEMSAYDAKATSSERFRSAQGLAGCLCGRQEEAMSISVVLSRTPSRAYVFRRRWKGRFQRSKRQSRTAG